MDYEVTVNYGRTGGKTNAQNAIPTSWDMRVIEQKWDKGQWIDDGAPLVQNVAIKLDSSSALGPFVE
ncbi:hypothetical protein Elgi_50220 [Paenibacillus elgii]|uniref:hypothetical protein n=1 Tax=Paenibacillus elgii TaxID=189691 RepID=UPI002D7CA310|nr:hypothetical protein Elgi_50220 [Paenibacillus elgii]